MLLLLTRILLALSEFQHYRQGESSEEGLKWSVRIFFFLQVILWQ